MLLDLSNRTQVCLFGKLIFEKIRENSVGLSYLLHDVNPGRFNDSFKFPLHRLQLLAERCLSGCLGNQDGKGDVADRGCAGCGLNFFKVEKQAARLASVERGFE